MAALPYKVECKSFAEFFEPIAAFNCEEAAFGYRNECQAANPNFEYRVLKGRKVLTNAWDAVK